MEYIGFKYNGKSLGMKGTDDFKGFIVNDGEGLQFVNSPEFSNEFAQMPYGKQTFYLGNTQGNRMFTLEIALKEVSLQEYRNFLMWLGLDTKGVLSFDYNSKYGYNVKVDSIENGVFEVVIVDCDVRKYNVELVVSFVTTGRAEARWIYTEPVWKGISHVDNITIDNDKNLDWIKESGENLIFYNHHNVNNGFIIRFKGKLSIGFDINFDSGNVDATYYSEHGVAIDDNGKFLSEALLNLVNLVSNGDLLVAKPSPNENQPLGFTTNFGNKSLSNGILTVQATGNLQNLFPTDHATLFNANDYYYTYARVKTSSTTMDLANTTDIISNNEWVFVSTIIKTSTSSSIVRIVDRASSDFQPIEIDYIGTINLTATFGAGNEPTKEQMDEIINRYGFFQNIALKAQTPKITIPPYESKTLRI